VQAYPLAVWPGRWAVCRLPPDAAVPPWGSVPGPLVGITRTEHELSILAPAERVPADVVAERDFRVIEIVGPVSFSVVGLMAAITQPLAEAGVSVFIVATYDTDYVLVREGSLDAAVRALAAARFTFKEQA
jgi:uncharacterized protein